MVYKPNEGVPQQGLAFLTSLQHNRPGSARLRQKLQNCVLKF
ncbi:hypothetical protein XAC3810_530360 [Xanthomonas citri pv. citri]|nr:hypothetical protein XAC9322_530356 [Xanthomonas citri pv. citri]CEE33930.1 hypothetical protein XAC3824_700004 [Xanthomonas citri pv. citri]CEE44144.1 hypothetical protein XAC3810_530360 [Xanthomonas citri pv. citri]CEE45564.1 hypothetical protein XAC902_720179 [Xanthomonas citri pv. citri]CEE46379.1 hypothetical protein XAC2911_610178 [Xanthomonas citri pv. citri]